MSPQFKRKKGQKARKGRARKKKVLQQPRDLGFGALRGLFAQTDSVNFVDCKEHIKNGVVCLKVNLEEMFKNQQMQLLKTLSKTQEIQALSLAVKCEFSSKIISRYQTERRSKRDYRRSGLAKEFASFGAGLL